MGKIIIERKKAIDLRQPYSILIDDKEIAQIENGKIKELEIEDGEHTIIITGGQTTDMETIGSQTGGLLGMLIGKQIDKIGKKHNKNKAIINVTSSKPVIIICKAGAYDCVIKEIK